MKQKGDAVIDSPDEGRKMVRQLHKYGAQVIKICATGGVFSHGDTPGAQQLTLEEIKAIVDEAHATGLRVAAHAHGASGIKAAILGGVDTIEHASLVDDEGIRLAVAARQLLRHGHLQHRLHPGRGQEERRAGGEPAEGPRYRRDPARRTSGRR